LSIDSTTVWAAIEKSARPITQTLSFQFKQEGFLKQKPKLPKSILNWKAGLCPRCPSGVAMTTIKTRTPKTERIKGQCRHGPGRQPHRNSLVTTTTACLSFRGSRLELGQSQTELPFDAGERGGGHAEPADVVGTDWGEVRHVDVLRSVGGACTRGSLISDACRASVSTSNFKGLSTYLPTIGTRLTTVYSFFLLSRLENCGVSCKYSNAATNKYYWLAQHSREYTTKDMF